MKLDKVAPDRAVACKGVARLGYLIKGLGVRKGFQLSAFKLDVVHGADSIA